MRKRRILVDRIQDFLLDLRDAVTVEDSYVVLLLTIWIRDANSLFDIDSIVQCKQFSKVAITKKQLLLI